jgi:hypothetical protein
VKFVSKPALTGKTLVVHLLYLPLPVIWNFESAEVDRGPAVGQSSGGPPSALASGGATVWRKSLPTPRCTAAERIAANRAKSRTWSEECVLEAVQAIEGGGVSLSDVTDKATVDAFLGPTARKDLESLPALSAAEDATVGSGRYGSAWRLPLGHEARASVGVRLAILGDRRTGVGLCADGLPDIDWRPVKGGDATIEVPTNPDNPNSRVVKVRPVPVQRCRESIWP